MALRTQSAYGEFDFAFEWMAGRGGNSGVKYRAYAIETSPGLLGGDAAPGEWNQARIIVTSDHVEHWLNGVQTVRYEVDVPFPSPIYLQYHHGGDVRFRNLKIRPAADFPK